MSETENLKIVAMGDTNAGKTTFWKYNFDPECKNDYNKASSFNATIGEHRESKYLNDFINLVYMDVGGQVKEKDTQHSGFVERDIFSGTSTILWFLKCFDSKNPERSMIDRWDNQNLISDPNNNDLVTLIRNEMIQLTNIIESIKKFEGTNTKVYIILSRFDEIKSHPKINGNEDKIKEWIKLLSIFFNYELSSKNNLDYFTGIFAISTKENFYFGLKGDVMINGTVPQLFRSLVPKQDQFDELLKKVSITLEGYGAKQIFLRLYSNEGLDISSPINKGYLDDEVNYFSLKKFSLIEEEEKLFFDGSYSMEWQVSVISSKSLTQIESEERHYVLWKKIEAGIYIIMIINFKNQLNIDIQKRIDSKIIGEISNYIDEIIKQINRIYSI